MDNTAKRGQRIAQTPPDYSFCAGCNSCEIVCALVHEGVSGHSHRRLTVRRDIRTMVHTVFTCQHCEAHPCYEACPKKDRAMKLDESGVVSIDESECIGCGKCHKACSFDPPRITYISDLPREQRKARKCDLCQGREEGPACVQWCPVKCLYVEKGAEL